jgi:hypothetical protein
MGNQFTTSAIASGKTFSVEVKDQRNCIVKTQLQHACEEQCTSRRCAYPLWLQPPKAGGYITYQQHDSNIRLRFNGKNVDLPNTLLNLPPSDLNTGFSATIAKAINKLNAAIQTALANFGKNRLVISYQPAESDPFGILLIEHFVSDTFNLEFGYSFANPDPIRQYTARYTNEPVAKGVPFSGTIFTNRSQKDLETRVPAFDCRERDQCGKEPDKYQKLCTATKAKPNIKISSKGSPFSFEGTVDNVGPEEIIAWIWHFPRGTKTSEIFYTGIQIVVELSDQEMNGFVILTVITEKGCFVTKMESILKIPG